LYFPVSCWWITSHKIANYEARRAMIRDADWAMTGLQMGWWVGAIGVTMLWGSGCTHAGFLYMWLGFWRTCMPGGDRRRPAGW